MMEEKNDKKVQVVCITYNHEKYIAEALESFVSQKTTFPFEVLVGDDCSPDGTRAIIEEYARRYPDIIKPVDRDQNMGPTRNLMDLCRRCTAPYIAFCEGDDYWVDEYKLQKQFDYMEAHPEAGFCFTKTKIVYPEDWGILDWYHPVNGEILIPDSVPGYQFKSSYFAHELLNIMPAQTSSYFFRWNYELEVPDWFYGGVVGDFPILMMQLGRKVAGFIPEVTSVYRRSDVGVFMTKDKTDHFIKTRCEYVRFLYGLYDFFKKNYNSYACPQIKHRLEREFINLIEACNKINSYDAFISVLEKYPQSMPLCFSNLINIYRKYHNQISIYGVKEYNCIFSDKKIINNVKKVLKLHNFLAFQKKKLHKLVGYLFFNKDFYLAKNPDVAAAGVDPREHFFTFGWKEGRRAYDRAFSPLRLMLSFLWYWTGALVPKKKNLWVFSSFYKRGYVDNTKYLFEYIVQHHPEIHAVWMTCDHNVLHELRERGLPVGYMKTLHSRWLMLRAELAFTDHFKSSDYDNIYGFNARTKVVQLWHGVGLKAMTPVNDMLPNTKVPGVRFSSDIMLSKNDTIKEKFIKTFRFILKSPFRELMERYYAFLCPGPEHIKFLVRPWRISEKACILSGHPRNIFLHSSPTPEKIKIIYAPTYRWNQNDEVIMIDRFIEAVPDIDEFLERVDGELVLRLHPHTWRNYQKKILSALEGHKRISMDRDKDVYTSLGSYSIMISDYSSIAFDFVLLDRPIIFLVPDRATFMEHDVSFNYPFDEFTPGPKVDTWQDVLAELDAYVNHPDKDGEWRQRVRAEFYDMSVNDADNSKRIVETLKRRLKIR